MAESTLSPEDFLPSQTQQAAQGLSRPSLSYWQDAWIRLKANRRALISLYIVIGLILFTVLGPLLWDVDPAAQDVDQISRPPGTDRVATIVPAYTPWNRVDEANPGSGLRLAGPATSQSARLLWDPVDGASRYLIYRNIFPLGPENALGLPLGETYLTTAFEDLLDLAPKRYYYTVVATDQHSQHIGQQTISAEVRRVITAEEVVDRGLAASVEDLSVGDSVTLRLHPLGTDYLGRDMLARLMHGARVSLFIGICAPVIFMLFGVIYGSAAGFLAGVADQALMRFADFVVALPFLLFMILFKILFDVGAGESGILPMLMAMVLLSWPGTARLVRGQILQIREEGYISASKLLGAKTNYLVLRHMIPNTMGVILVTLTFAVPSAIFTEAFLSFIGMGVVPPTPSWGSMCNEGIKTMLTTPHELIFPALLISVTVLAFNLLGDGLRDALDARMRSME
jgi:oligopeptide transport system permease protein